MRIVEGRATIDDVDAFVARLDGIGGDDCAVTAFDARYVAGHDHLAAAVERANRAVERDDAIADDRAIEVLLYAAGRRQIDRALRMGVSEGTTPVAVVVDGEGEDAAADAVRDLLDPAEVLPGARDEALIADYFGVTDAERGATDASLEDLVIERVALLVVEK